MCCLVDTNEQLQCGQEVCCPSHYEWDLTWCIISMSWWNVQWVWYVQTYRWHQKRFCRLALSGFWCPPGIVTHFGWPKLVISFLLLAHAKLLTYTAKRGNAWISPALPTAPTVSNSYVCWSACCLYKTHSWVALLFRMHKYSFANQHEHYLLYKQKLHEGAPN